jgi:hypothetical protein
VLVRSLFVAWLERGSGIVMGRRWTAVDGNGNNKEERLGWLL